VGVFEVLEEPTQYKKTPGIYVINNDKIVLLRTLVLIKSGTTVPKDISNYFLKELPLQKQTNKQNVGVLKNKRLEAEYKKLSGLDFVVEIDTHDQSSWRIDFEPVKNKNISVELVFSNYPINPPIIKLVSAQIKISGLVGSDGIISIELVNPANWKITNNLCEIVTILYKCFQESL
jgi:ubiquitin-protein ligase